MRLPHDMIITQVNLAMQSVLIRASWELDSTEDALLHLAQAYAAVALEADNSDSAYTYGVAAGHVAVTIQHARIIRSN